ncbi:MAG: hypothetical protein ACJAVY_002500 [Marinoscillum sp.]|jgi:uncharacterized protein YehS (DUF1456 family)
MDNNDILRRLRFTFDLNDDKMMAAFALGGFAATRAEVSEWLKPADNPEQKPLVDKNLAAFLNGFIIKKRGARDGEQPKPEKSLNNNMILRKLKIALNFKDEDILDIMQLIDLPMSKHELSAFFRKPTQSQYRVCKDQFLRNFLLGLQHKLRGTEPE